MSDNDTGHEDYRFDCLTDEVTRLQAENEDLRGRVAGMAKRQPTIPIPESKVLEIQADGLEEFWLSLGKHIHASTVLGELVEAIQRLRKEATDAEKANQSTDVQ